MHNSAKTDCILLTKLFLRSHRLPPSLFFLPTMVQNDSLTAALTTSFLCSGADYVIGQGLCVEAISFIRWTTIVRKKTVKQVFLHTSTFSRLKLKEQTSESSNG